jgi:hypothetical protein
MRNLRTLLLLGSLVAGIPRAWAYEPSLFNMTVPSALEAGDLDLLFEHRFYGSALDNPLQSLFGLAIGANVGFGARYLILPGLQARALYSTGGQEITVGAGYGYHFPSLPLGVQLDADFISPQGAAGRGYGVFTSVTAQAGPVAKILSFTVEAAYDSYLNHLGLGIGARVDVLPTLAIIGEFYPYFTLGGEQHPEELGSTSAYAAGLMISTFGHQFSLLAGNSSAIGDRRLMAGASSFGGLYLGFNIQRRFP